jgi:hypothetical protein
MRRWSEGVTAADAVRDAYRFASAGARLLGSFLPENDTLLSLSGIARSEPVLRGVDLDVEGRQYSGRTLAIDPIALRGPETLARRKYAHTDFERTAIALLGAGVPQTTLDPDFVPTAQAFVDQAKDIAWETLRDSFPTPLPQMNAALDGEDEIWFDGETLRYLLEPARAWTGPQLDQVLDRLTGLRLTRVGNASQVAVYFDRAFTVELQPEDDTPNWDLYAIDVPQTIRFEFTMIEGTLYVSGLDSGDSRLGLRAKLPFLPDLVRLRSASANLETGDVRIEAGVIRNTIAVVAEAQLMARTFDGIDIWGSIRRNLPILTWPAVSFRLR